MTNNGSDVSFGKITGYKEVKDYIYKISETGIIGEHPNGHFQLRRFMQK
ncbi:MAG: hypothetical protein ACLVBP_00485 [Ruminococcus sp.]